MLLWARADAKNVYSVIRSIPFADSRIFKRIMPQLKQVKLFARYIEYAIADMMWASLNHRWHREAVPPWMQ